MDNIPQEETTKEISAVDTGMANDQPTQSMAPVTTASSKKSKKKWLFAGVATVVVAAIATVGVYAGVVVPNKPENVWNKAMEQTGKGFSVMNEKVGTIFGFKTMKGEGSFTAKASGIEVSGDSKIESSENVSNMSINVKALNNDIKVDLISTKEQDSTYPNMYFKLGGLSDITVGGAKLSQQMPNISQIDGQWFTLSADDYEELLNSAEQQAGLSGSIDTSQIPTLENKDLKAIVDVVMKTAENSLFSEDETKSVVKMNSFIGKEDRNGREAYRYSVSIDPDNTQEFVKSLVDGLKSTKIEEVIKASGASLNDIDTSDIANSLKDFEKNTKTEIWVDADTKLVRAVRLIDAKGGKQYIEFSMEYNGNDSYPFVISAMLGESEDMVDVRLEANVDVKTNKTKLVAKVSSPQFTADADFTINHSNDELKVDVPTDAESVQELMTLLGVDTNDLGGLLNGQETDSPSDAIQSCLGVIDATLLQECITENLPTEYN